MYNYELSTITFLPKPGFFLRYCINLDFISLFLFPKIFSIWCFCPYVFTSFERNVTGTRKAKTVRPRSLYFKIMSPFKALVISWLHVNPSPMLKSWTLLKSCFVFSSYIGKKRNFCLSSDIPIPESIICVSRTWLLVSSSSVRLQVIVITMSP